MLSGGRILLVPPRVRQGHIFPTVVDNGANGKANCLKFRSVHSQALQEQMILWPRSAGEPCFSRRVVGYAVCCEQPGLVHLFLVFRNLPGRWHLSWS